MRFPARQALRLLWTPACGPREGGKLAMARRTVPTGNPDVKSAQLALSAQATEARRWK